MFRDAGPPGNPGTHFQSLVDGWDVANLRSRLCDKPYGVMVYFFKVATNIFAKIASIAEGPAL